MKTTRGFNKTEYQNSYISKAYDRVNLTLYKGQKAWITAQMLRPGESLNAYIHRAIRAQIIADGGDVSAWDALGRTEQQGGEEPNSDE